MVFDWLAAILESVLAIMAADPGDAEHDDTDDDPF
jgi:hypothetical protein